MNRDYRHLKIGILAGFILIFTYLILSFDIFNRNSIFTLITQDIYSMGMEIIFIGVVTILLIFFVPISWLSAISAVLFGLRGAIFISIGGILSAIISFSIARIFKDDVSRIIDRIYYRKKRKLTLDEIYLKIKKYGFGYVLFLRSLPFIPFSMGNYIFGISFIPFKQFVFATLLAVSIGQGINVYFFDKALRIGENPIDTLIAGVIKGIYFLVIFLWSRKSKYNAKD
ncbi:VTT domain-containing protein [Schnuerera sp. xch1]|uniref:TVP38/TMEM64 family protein n=1 Tax=Schnuerera sp. xch1 TaxID=2874283 RepID=UPI001CBCDCB0|nr:VTT domain-containing protein [Schnuerera sp. xch1]MBZ2174859.1 VTT domain-containing protein [Schnuerera sp. xch1]